MFYGYDECFACPRCEKVIYNPTLVSGNTYGARTYSDLRQVAPMLPNFPKISKCPKCQIIFWLNEEHSVERENSEEKKMAEFLSLEDNVVALMNKNYQTNQQERELRLDLWWAFNDRVINDKPLLKSELEKVIWKQNLIELLEILNVDDLDDKVIMAEIYRNLGDFEKSKELIECLNTDEYQSIFQQYVSQIEINNTKVFEITTIE